MEAPPGGSSGTVASATASASPADSRLAELEASFLEGPLVPGTGGQARSFSTETLLDILVVLFDESVFDFIESGQKMTDGVTENSEYAGFCATCMVECKKCIPLIIVVATLPFEFLPKQYFQVSDFQAL